MIDMRTSTIQS